MEGGGAGVASLAPGVGLGVGIIPLGVLPDVGLTELAGVGAGMLKTAEGSRGGVDVPQAGGVGVGSMSKGVGAAPGGLIGGGMMSLKDKTGAAEGLDVGRALLAGGVGVWLVLLGAVTGVNVGRALLKGEEVGPAAPIQGPELGSALYTGGASV